MSIQDTLTQALGLISQGKYAKARALCRKCLHKAPDHFHAHLIYGVALLKSFEVDKAISALQTALSKTNTPALLAQAHGNLSACYLQNHQSEHAAESAQAAIRLDNSKVDYHLNLIAAQEQQQAWPAMQQACLHLLQLWPDETSASLSLAIACRQLQQYTMALKAISQSTAQQGTPLTVELTSWFTRPNQGLPAQAAALKSSIPAEWLFEWALNSLLASISAGSEPYSREEYGMQLAFLHFAIDRPETPQPQLASQCADYFAEANQADLAMQWYELAHQLNPADSYSHHMANALKGESSSHAPSTYVEALYNQSANAFEQRLVKQLGYQAPSILVDELVQQGHSEFSHILDLGCGTGLLGDALKGKIKTDWLVGQDLSSAMLKQAEDKGEYQHLIKGDLLAPWPSHTSPWPLICATDVFIYMGDLAPLFAQAKAQLAPNGYFAFTTEQMPHSANSQAVFRLATSGRYQHATQAVLDLAQQHGFETLVQKTFLLRNEGQKPLLGDLFIFKQCA